jgi:membrane-associated PAP2 superfamily phosphatase
MQIERPGWIDAGLLLGLISLTLCAIHPEWELALTACFHDPFTGWHLNDLWWVRIVDNWGPVPSFLLALAGLIVGLGAGRWPTLRRYRTIGWFLCLSMAVGPGLLVNRVFKEHFGRPRPAQLAQFGGDAQFRQIGEPGIGVKGRSFPSGHASTGFILMAPYLFLRRRHHRMAVRFLLLGITAGLGIGTVRVLQGAHFLGDVVASGLMVWIVCRATWWLLNRSAPVHTVTAPPIIVAAGTESLMPLPEGSPLVAHPREGAEGPILSPVIPAIESLNNRRITR